MLVQSNPAWVSGFPVFQASINYTQFLLYLIFLCCCGTLALKLSLAFVASSLSLSQKLFLPLSLEGHSALGQGLLPGTTGEGRSLRQGKRALCFTLALPLCSFSLKENQNKEDQRCG